jgi:hypothetical protein
VVVVVAAEAWSKLGNRTRPTVLDFVLQSNDPARYS